MLQLSAPEQKRRGLCREDYTGETYTLIVRLVVEKIDNLTCKEMASFANTDLELAGRSFGDSNVTIIFGELDGEYSS